MNSPNTKRFAVLAKCSLFLTALIWGTSFVILKNTMETISIPYIMIMRFGGAAVIMLCMSLPFRRYWNLSYLKGGCLMGLCLFTAFFVQTLGLTHTTPGKNAFLTASYCIIVPFLSWLIYKQRPNHYHLLGAFLCIIGIGLVSLQNDLTFGVGELLSACSGFFFALHMIVTSHYVESRHPILLNAIQFSVVAILAWVVSFFYGVPPQNLTAHDIFPIIYLCVFSTAGCYLFQSFGQKYATPTSVAVILSLESVFGTTLSVLFYGETLSIRLVVGFVLIFAAILISETKLAFLQQKHKIAKGTVR